MGFPEVALFFLIGIIGVILFNLLLNDHQKYMPGSKKNICLKKPKIESDHNRLHKKNCPIQYSILYLSTNLIDLY